MYRQKEFYDQPRFHTSIAWALLSSVSEGPAHTPHNDPNDAPTTACDPAPKSGSNPDEAANPVFETIPCFPQDLVPTLEREFGAILRSRHVGTFEAEYVCVKIGKDVAQYRLRGDT